MATLTTSYQKIGTGGVQTFGATKARIDLYAKYNSQSIDNNNSNWSIEARLVITSGSYIGEYSGTTLTLSGDGISSSQSKGTGNFKSQTLGSASGTVTHNSDGTKSISASASMKFSTWGQTLTVSGSATLPTIPRYVTITEYEFTKKTETTATFKWNTSRASDGIQYSVNNGSWVNGAWPTTTISGLSANTTYNVKIRCKARDSQLWTESANKSITTYAYPYCTSSPNFVIGNNLHLTFYNPLSRSIRIYIIGADGTQYGGDTITGTTIDGYAGTGWLNWWYSTIPNATSGKYQVKVVYGNIIRTRNNGNTYTINANNCKPTFSDFEYSTDLLELTGDNDTIINGKTNATVTISSTNKAVGKYSATIQRYSVQCGTQTAKLINYSSDSDVSVILNNCNSDILKVTAIDSRGLETTVTKTVTNFRNYYVPTFMSFNVDRENGIDTTAYLDVKIQFWNYNFGNEDNEIQQINYRVKEQGTDTWSNWFTTNPSSWVINEEQLTITNAIVYSDGVSQGFTVGKTYNFQLQAIDGTLNDNLSTVESAVFNLVDGKVAFSVLKDNNEEYHIGINGMPNNNFELNILGKLGINGEEVKSLIPKTVQTTSDDDVYSCNYINTLLQNFYPFKKEYYGTAGQTVNVNDFITSGIYLFDTNITINNRPTKVIQALEFMIVIEAVKWTNCTIQIWFNGSSALFFRLRNWNTWASWKRITIT